MRGFRPWMGVAIGVAFFAWFTQCAPEQLVYESSLKDASTDKGKGGDSSGIGGKPSWTEICGNGFDDDNDGKTDCEDPQCANYACVALPPAGWQGPAALFQGASGSLPQCPKGLTSIYEGHLALSFEPADCSAGCSCGSPATTSCSGTITYNAGSSCTSPLTSAGLSSGMSCGAGYTATTVASIRVDGAGSGSCGTGTPLGAQKSAVTWTSDVRACALQTDAGKQAGCEPGKVCAPATSLALACIYQAGDIDCPAGYDTRYVSYSSYSDTRDCGSCPCTFASDGCTFPFNAYSATDCLTQVTSGTSGNCYSGDIHAITTGTFSIQNPSCTSGTSDPSGCVTPDQPTTLCCAGGTGSPCPSGGGPKMVQAPALDGSTYCIDSTEVTKAQYAAFIATSPVLSTDANCLWNLSYTPASGWPAASGDEDKPVTYVDWCDAVAFCTWAGKRLCGKIGGGPLPGVSSASQPDVSQWDNACSAGGTLTYPYGNTLVTGVCNTSGTTQGVKQSPCCQGGFTGLYDLVGNALEWEDGCDTQNPKLEAQQCSTRGSSACNTVAGHSRKDKTSTLGFRCCT